MNDKNEYDAFDDAMTDEQLDFYGQIEIEAYQGFFQSGSRGGIPYDEMAHGPDQWHMLLIDVTYTPIDPTRKIIFDTLSKSGKKKKDGSGKRWPSEFLTIFRPAVELLVPRIAEMKGLTIGQFNPLQQIRGMNIQAAWVPRPDESGYNCLKPTGIFDTEAACRAAYEEAAGKIADDSIPFTPDEVAAADDPQRAAFATFLPPLWAKAKEHEDDEAVRILKMAKLLADSPQLKAHFDINSPEVQEVMSK